MEVMPEKRYGNVMKRKQSNNTGSSDSITAGFERVRRAINDAPATTRNIGFSIYLEFYPRENTKHRN